MYQANFNPVNDYKPAYSDIVAKAETFTDNLTILDPTLSLKESEMGNSSDGFSLSYSSGNSERVNIDILARNNYPIFNSQPLITWSPMVGDSDTR